MIGWHSNQHLFSQGTTALVERWRKFAECGGDTMKINVIVLYMFLLQITLYNFSGLHCNDSRPTKYVFVLFGEPSETGEILKIS